MASQEEDIEPSSITKLPLSSITQPFQVQSPTHSGMLTPPLAKVPFRWEEEPGKPRPCSAIIPRPQDIDITKCLELPPRLFSSEQGNTKTASPTTVLDAPMFDAPSFRLITGPEKGRLSAIVLSRRRNRLRIRRGWFASWGRKLNLKGQRDDDDDDDDRNSFIFPSSSSLDGRECDRDYDSEGCGSSVKVTNLRRSGSFLGFARARSSYLWGAIYGGLKQIMPGKGNKKLKKDEFSI